jgi:hypothetical protein
MRVLPMECGTSVPFCCPCVHVAAQAEEYGRRPCALPRLFGLRRPDAAFDGIQSGARAPHSKAMARHAGRRLCSSATFAEHVEEDGEAGRSRTALWTAAA